MITEISSATFIAEGSRVQGNLTFFSQTQIFGVVEGEVLQQSLEPIQIGKTGWIHGSISSRGPVIIEGRVEGNVYSATRITIRPTATVLGSVVAPSMQVQNGAQVQGDFIMQGLPEAPALLRRAA